MGKDRTTATIDTAEQKATEFEAETCVLRTLRGRRLFAIELAPEENLTPGDPTPIGGAIERCLTIGWIGTGGPGSVDGRLWLADPGRAELIRRSAKKLGGSAGDEAS